MKPNVHLGRRQAGTGVPTTAALGAGITQGPSTSESTGNGQSAQSISISALQSLAAGAPAAIAPPAGATSAVVSPVPGSGQSPGQSVNTIETSVSFTIAGSPVNLVFPPATVAPGGQWIISFSRSVAPEGSETLFMPSVPVGVVWTTLPPVSGHLVQTTTGADHKLTPVTGALPETPTITLFFQPRPVSDTGPASSASTTGTSLTTAETASRTIPSQTGGVPSATNAMTPTGAVGSKKNGLSGGAIGGIVVAVVAVLGLAIAAFIFSRRRKHGSKRRNPVDRGLLGHGGGNGYDDHELQMNKQPKAALAPVAMRNRESILFDQPKDDAAIKSQFDSADDALADHIENFYIPKNDISEADVILQMKRIPREQNIMIESNRILSHSNALLRDRKTRGYALRALAGYFLYDGVMGGGFLPKDLKVQLERARSTRNQYSAQTITENRLTALHRFAQSDGYSSALDTSIQSMTKSLDGLLLPFAVMSDNPQRQTNLQNVVRRFAELAITLGKQPTIYTAELLARDFSSAEASKADKLSKEKVVRFVGMPFDDGKMEQENSGADEGRIVRAVVAPGVRKEGDHGAQVIRKSKVIVL